MGFFIRLYDEIPSCRSSIFIITLTAKYPEESLNGKKERRWHGIIGVVVQALPWMHLFCFMKVSEKQIEVGEIP